MSQNQGTAQILRQWFAAAVGINADQIDPMKPMAAYGIDSVAAVEIATKIQEKWEIKVPQSLAWDYPTLHALANHIEEKKAKDSSRGKP